MRRVSLAAALLTTGAVALPQHGTVEVSGTVLDSSGGLISDAPVVLRSAHGDLLRASTGAKGDFRFDSVVPGKYELRVEYPGFSLYQVSLTVGTKPPKPVQIVMSIAQAHASLRVESSTERLSTEVSENMDALRLDPRQLENLPMLDRDVIGAISRSRGPAAMAAGGTSVIVDGLETTGRGIPLSQIQEVTINNNPYSAEFAQPGRARIEIITKSGSEQYHGSIYTGLRDYRLDARNAFAGERPPERHRQLEADLSGPIHGDKNNTFLLNVSGIQDNLEPSVYAFGLNGPILENASQGQTSTYFSAQYTRRIGTSALSFRYAHFDWSDKGEGAGGLVLENGIDSTIRYDQLYFSYRAVINPRVLNDFLVRARVQRTETQSELPGVPKVVVQGAFTAGGAQVQTRATDDHIEFADHLSWTHGKNLFKAGVSVPTFGRFGSTDQSNLDGAFYFSSLIDYASGTPYAFTKQAGDGHLVFWQKQVGAFVQDEINLRPNLSLAAGLRYDWRNYGSDYHNAAPRLSLAYSPGKARKIVFRAGAGFFFEPVPAAAIADTLLLNGRRLLQIQLLDPLFPNPLEGGIPVADLPPNIVRFSPTLKSPYLFKYSFGVERQLQKSLTWTATFSGTRGVDLFRSRDVNAPLPPAYLTPPNPLLGVFRQIESSGGLKSQSMEMTLRGGLSRFFSGMIVYELSHATNDTDGIGSFPANNWEPAGEWSRASFDTRHFVYLYGTLTAGEYFTFGIILSANSGRPYTMTTGVDAFNDGMINARPAGVPRNTLQGSGAMTLDVNWSKEFALPTLGERRKIEPVLRVGADAFNILNRVNYSSYVGNLSSPFFGKPVSADPARRLQFSLTLRF